MAMDAEELELRRREVDQQRWHIVVSVGLLLVGFVTAGAAAWAAWQATRAVTSAESTALRASRQQRISDGFQAMGGDSPAQRIAGLTMLRRVALEGLERVERDPDALADEDENETRATYLSTLKSLENYIGAWHLNVDGVNSSSEYSVPKDVLYAVNELKALLAPRWEAPLNSLGLDRVSVDLAWARLRGAHLGGADLGWVRTKFLRGIDLRSATLTGSTWECATLDEAILRSDDPNPTPIRDANFRGASLRGADLRNADLRGADLRGADLTGADLTGARLDRARLTGATLTDEQLASALNASAEVAGDALPQDFCELGRSDRAAIG